MNFTWETTYLINLDTGVTTAIIKPVSSVRYQVSRKKSRSLMTRDTLIHDTARLFGLILLSLGIGGFFGPLIPTLRLESGYAFSRAQSFVTTQYERFTTNKPQLPESTPVVFNPMIAPDGSTITPVNTEFAIIVPKIGINAPIIANVDPANPAAYGEALEQGVAHAASSFLPDERGTVYLFSHSTNYDWFVKDLNAVFYLVKNLEAGDIIVVYHKGKQYTYQLKETKVVAPTEISYLVPNVDKKSLILQTCWPPGSVSERFLLFADLISEQ